MFDYQRGPWWCSPSRLGPCRGGDGWASRQGGPAATWLIAVNSSVFLICSSWPKEQQSPCCGSWLGMRNIYEYLPDVLKQIKGRRGPQGSVWSLFWFQVCFFEDVGEIELSVLGWVNLGLQFHGRIVGCHQGEKSEVRISVGTCSNLCVYEWLELGSEMNGSNRDMINKRWVDRSDDHYRLWLGPFPYGR